VKLPFIQVTQETWEYAAQLAALRGIDEGVAFRLVCDLWRWGLSLGPDAAPPEGICDSPRAERLLAAAVRWVGEAGPLVDDLVDLGLVARMPGGIRVRGMSRYHSAWRKNRRLKPGNRTEPERPPPGIPPASERNRSGDADADADEIKKKKDIGKKTEPHPLVEMWNAKAHKTLPRVTKLTPRRRTAAEARWGDCAPAQLERALDELNASPLCRGEVPGRDGAQPWAASFDWFVKADSIAKLLEGNYRDRKAAPARHDPNEGIMSAKPKATCERCAAPSQCREFGLAWCYPCLNRFHESGATPAVDSFEGWCGLATAWLEIERRGAA